VTPPGGHNGAPRIANHKLRRKLEVRSELMESSGSLRRTWKVQTEQLKGKCDVRLARRGMRTFSSSSSHVYFL